jgi:transcriptional regulator with GAF, ATPase, and Fis domain
VGCAATLTDLGSSNGTQVNGKTIKEPQLLEAGDIIRIGNSFLVFREHSFLDNDVVIPTLVGQSPFIRALRTQIRTIAATANITLLQGKSGVGKEVAARAIHDLSGRKGRFLAVNCATIEKELADSTWFGHKKGAFTGAHEDRQGCFEQAAGGTLFLDEIGELDFKVQSKLLRVVEGDYRPLGHQGQPLKTDARLIAATNVDLQRAVDQGKFRDDLYYRLSANTLYIPPLRDRSEDILLLAKSFLLQEKADDVTVTPRLAEALLGYPFPGNVRETRTSTCTATWDDAVKIRLL